jgi:hypothetical protein
MKANELRIGNKVSYEGSNVTVNTIADDEVTFSDYASFDYPQIEDISGIELTDELLIRFGWKDGFAKGMLIRDGLKIRLLGHDMDTKYVHQLQNLYFALTGEELKQA